MKAKVALEALRNVATGCQAGGQVSGQVSGQIGALEPDLDAGDDALDPAPALRGIVELPEAPARWRGPYDNPTRLD